MFAPRSHSDNRTYIKTSGVPKERVSLITVFLSLKDASTVHLDVDGATLNRLYPLLPSDKSSTGKIWKTRNVYLENSPIL